MSSTSSPASVESSACHLPEDHPSRQYATLPAKELLAFVQVASSELSSPDAQIIYTAFYYRYFGYLYTIISNCLGNVYDRDAQREIIDDALAGFFRAAHKLKLPDNVPDEQCDQIVRAYLGQLAKWKASDARSFQAAFGRVVIDLKELEIKINEQARITIKEHEPPATSLPVPEDPRVKAVREWMATLRELERDILRTYFIDTHSGQKSPRLPNGVADRLAKKHQTTTSNIRHLKAKLEKLVREKFRDL
ncbi:MAG: hypothetical protein QM790_16095 [Nibricoccus sp.]